METFTKPITKLTAVASTQQSIGVFDSGIGGLIALRKLAELLPHENLLYLGDTARVPYGNRSVETIIHYSRECIRFLLEHSVKQILVACNTVSAVALPALQKLSTVPVVGVIKPAVNLVLDKKYQRVGVIGTRTTIQSCSYETEILTHSHNGRSISIYSQACPLFVPVIEEGWETHDIAHTIAEKYLGDIKKANVEALILGCTHYSFLVPVLHKLLPGVDLIDSGEEAANTIAQQNSVIPNNSSEHSLRKIECYVTDLTPTFVHLAQQFLGLPSELLHQTDLKKINKNST